MDSESLNWLMINDGDEELVESLMTKNWFIDGYRLVGGTGQFIDLNFYGS